MALFCAIAAPLAFVGSEVSLCTRAASAWCESSGIHGQLFADPAPDVDVTLSSALWGFMLEGIPLYYSKFVSKNVELSSSSHTLLILFTLPAA